MTGPGVSFPTINISIENYCSSSTVQIPAEPLFFGFLKDRSFLVMPNEKSLLDKCLVALKIGIIWSAGILG